MRRRWYEFLLPYFVVLLIGSAVALAIWVVLRRLVGSEVITWANPGAFLLVGGAVLVAWVRFHLRAQRAATLAYTRVGELAQMERGIVSHFGHLPDAFRVVEVALLAVALARPQTYQTTAREVEGIDMVIVLDLSKSMEESDMRRNRLDAGQRTIRNFLRNRENDRIGLVVFAQVAVTQCPLTRDYLAVDQIVADLAIGDVPEMGTAIGDALALALASLRRSDAGSKVVILLSDGDSNWTTKFGPLEAKNLAVDMGVQVFTLLVGHDGGRPGPWGRRRYAVNPELLQQIARDTGGLFFRAGDDLELEESFQKVRQTLEKTRHREVRRVADRELFAVFLAAALLLLAGEVALRLTRWRRFP